LSSLLLEEIDEIKSIYYTISKQLVSEREVPEFKELINAIRAKVDADINELEWIKQYVTEGLRILLQKNKKAYKDLYTQTLHSLHAIKYRAIVLSRLTDIISLYSHLTYDDEYKVYLITLKELINNIEEHLRSTPGPSLYVLVEYGYSAINILKERNVIVLCIPSYDLFKPWKWVLLFHELGHVLFDIEREAFIKEFRRRIMPLLKQLAPTSFNREHAVLRIWEQYWLGEFVSDLYGVSLGGPAYTYAFMIEVFDSNPSGYRETHPSLDSRVYLQLRYLENIKEAEELTNNVRELWLSHRESIVAEGLEYPFTSNVLDELNRIFIDITKRPVFLDYISKVIELRDRINRGEFVKADSLSLILALALSSRGKDEEAQRKAIKTIVEGRQ